MKEELRDRFLHHLDKSTGESIEASLNTLKETSFYAHVLVTAFQKEVDQDTTVTDHDSWHEFAIGAKLKERDDGYLRLTGNLQTTNLQLILSQWGNWNDVGSDRLRESLFHRPNNFWSGYQDFVIISSDDNRHAGMTIPIKGNEKIMIESDLRFEFAIGRWQIAPSNPKRSFLWWTITKFIPKFMEEYVAPFATVPPQEMRGWVP